MEINKIQHIHFIGIGGVGVSGLAIMALELGIKVTGSDLALGKLDNLLLQKGAALYRGHDAINLGCPDLVVISSAVSSCNPELTKAIQKKIPIMKRGEFLAKIVNAKKSFVVAGTHGKTTTASFLASILYYAKEREIIKMEVGHYIGGILKKQGCNAHLPSKNDNCYLAVESDESDGSFLFLNPYYSCVTNIDLDHLEHYGGEKGLLNAFRQFIVSTKKRCIINFDDIRLRKMVVDLNITSFAIDEQSGADYFVKNIISKDRTSFDLFKKEKFVGRFTIDLFGIHNISNALGAICLAIELDLEPTIIQKGIEEFRGVERRFEKIYESEQKIIYDDYAHHPTEIKATLKAFKSMAKDSPITVVFEPHRYTRTRDCYNEFISCFDNADELIMLPLFAASEKPIEGISSKSLAQDIRRRGHENVKELKKTEELFDLIKENRSWIISLGAGPISKLMRDIVLKL